MINRREKMKVLVEILESLADEELTYRQEWTGEKANLIFGRDYDLLDALRTWDKKEMKCDTLTI